MTQKQDKVLTIDELAVYLKISKSTLYKLVQKGEIPGLKVGKHWQFRYDIIDQWLRAGQPPASSIRRSMTLILSVITRLRSITCWWPIALPPTKSALNVKSAWNCLKAPSARPCSTPSANGITASQETFRVIFFRTGWKSSTPVPLSLRHDAPHDPGGKGRLRPASYSPDV